MGAGVLEPEERDAPLDLHAGLGQLLDEHALVLILGEDQRVRKGAQPGAHGAENRARQRWPVTHKFTASSRLPRSTRVAASPICR
jgi:hypothetical protein